MRTVKPHHQRAIDKLVERYRGQSDVLAIIIAGSIAKGNERDDSDVDAMMIVTETEYRRRERALALAMSEFDLCDYEGGYVDLKFFPKEYLKLAAERGSEPTRYAFSGAYCVYTQDAEIADLIGRIPIYPRGEKTEKIYSFYSQFLLNKLYFWEQAEKRDDPYLKGRVATELVLYGSRLILAHNEVLFPCHKSLLDTVSRVSEKPENYLTLAADLLRAPSMDTVVAFCDAVEQCHNWGGQMEWAGVATRYVDDAELWWWKQRPVIAEW